METESSILIKELNMSNVLPSNGYTKPTNRNKLDDWIDDI